MEAGVIPRRLHRAISAGAPLPLPLEQAVFERCGLKLHNFLGASECGGIAYDASETPRTDVGMAGTPLQGVSLTIDDGGCLVVRSPAVGSGYWPMTDPHLGDGVYRSGDLAELGDDGGVRLRGRAGDGINVAGRKVQPEMIETELLRHPAVTGALVLGLPLEDSGTRGDTVAAVLQTASVVTDGELRDFLLTRLPAWQIPRLWHRVDALEVNARGKLSRAEWRSRIMALRTDSSAGGALPRS